MEDLLLLIIDLKKEILKLGKLFLTHFFGVWNYFFLSLEI